MRSVLRPGSPVAEKYEFIDSCRTSDAQYAYPVKKMCMWLSVSPSGFFDWRKRPDSLTTQRRDRLKVLIVDVFRNSDETYGYRRVHAVLARTGVPCGPELVRGIMRELDLQPCQPRPYVGLTEQDGSDHRIPDLVDRDFTAPAPGEKFVGDITYIPTWEGWVYLATVIDCHTRMVVGYAMGEDYRTPLIQAALQNAVRNVTVEHEAIFHSDRGSNYTSYEFGKTVSELGFRQSVGRTGICYDNAMAESFFGTLKNERVHRTVYPTRAHARADITRYIEFWYNRDRLHSGLGYKSPQEVLDEWTSGQAVA